MSSLIKWFLGIRIHAIDVDMWKRKKRLAWGKSPHARRRSNRTRI